jgi:CubicO group peptidase (beta-lactamase class C family)
MMSGMHFSRLFLILCASAALAADAARLSRIPARFQQFVDQGQLAGAVTLIAVDGRVVAHDAVGYQDIETKTPMRKDSIFQIMSMTKPVVSAGILMLAEEGKLAIDDPVMKHLPEFAGQLGGSRPITIQDLLTHTSGLATQPPLADLYARMDLTLADAVKLYARTKLDFEPGTRWQYSNMGIDTLGRIIEVRSGMPFETFLAKRILEPLGMKDTFIFPPADKISRIALVHQVKDGKLVRAKNVFYGGDPAVFRRGAKFSAPSYGLYSTALDLFAFYEMMRNGGFHQGKQLLSKASVEQATKLHTGNLRAGHQEGTGFGLAWEVTKEPAGTLNLMSIGSFGHGGAFGTHGWVDPAKKLVGVYLVQSSDSGDNAFQKAVFLTMAGGAVSD